MCSTIQESIMRGKSILVYCKSARKTNTSSRCESLFLWISTKAQKRKQIKSLYLLIFKVLCTRKLIMFLHSKIDLNHPIIDLFT